MNLNIRKFRIFKLREKDLTSCFGSKVVRAQHLHRYRRCQARIIQSVCLFACFFQILKLRTRNYDDLLRAN